MIEVEGLAELDIALGLLPKATASNVLKRVGLKSLDNFVTIVRELAPMDDPANTPKRPPGTLKNSYHAGTKLNKSQARTAKREGKSFVEVYAGTNDPAGVQTEFGNEHQAAEPHARPAWEATQQGTIDYIAKNLMAEIDKAALRVAKKRGF